MDTRVDINLEAVSKNSDRDFEKEIDDFIFGGFVDWVRRDETGCYVLTRDAWIPVVDWKKKYEFSGARNLSYLARYFYNLGQMEMRAGEIKPKQEWNENDERILKGIIGKIDHDQTYGVSKAEMLSFLEGLRPSWKPSEEHLSALLAIFNDPDNIGSQTCQLALADLYEQLKKLM